MRRRGAGVKGSKYLMTAESNPEVFAVCLAQGWCSSEGMTYEDAAAITNIGTIFRGNTQITHFDEFEYFIGVTEITQRGLLGMRNLSSIKFPPSLVTIHAYGIQDLSSLKTLFIPQSVTAIGGYQSGLSSLESIIVSDSNQTFDSRDNCNAVIRSSDNVLFIGCKNTTIPNNIVAINASAFWSMNIFQLDIPSSVSSIGALSLAGNPDLTTIICRATTPPSVSENTFGNVYNPYVGYNTRNQGINRLYVPKGCSANYNTSYWSSILLDSSKCGFTIYELNEDGTIPQND